MTINDVLTYIGTGDYTGWEAATLPEKWQALKEAEAAGRLEEIAAKLAATGGGFGSRVNCKVSIGVELNRRANPEKSANIRAWFG